MATANELTTQLGEALEAEFEQFAAMYRATQNADARDAMHSMMEAQDLLRRLRRARMDAFKTMTAAASVEG